MSKRPFSCADELEDLDIDINGKDISDIIAFTPSDDEYFCGYFWNNMTKKGSNNLADVVRPEINYILVHDVPYIEGYYVKHLDEYDAIVLVTCRLQEFPGLNGSHMYYEWEETSRQLLYRDWYGCGWGDELSGRIDICGQSMIYKNATAKCMCDYIAVGAKREFISHFGGINIEVESDTSFVVNTLKDEDCFDNFFNYAGDFSGWDEERRNNYNEYYRFNETGIVSSKEIVFTKDRAPIPKKAKERLDWYIDAWFKGSLEDDSPAEALTYYLPYFSFIDKMEGVLFLRVFVPIVFVANPVEKSEIELTEVADFNLEDLIKDSMSMKEIMPSVCVWHCDLKDTVLEHTASYIDEAMEKFEDELTRQPFPLAKAKMDSHFEDKYGIKMQYMVVLSIEKANNLILEMILNYKKDDYRLDYIKRFIIDKACLFSAEYSLHECFHDIDETKSRLWEIVGLPKGLMEYISQEKEMALIPQLKQAFCGSMEGKQYFQRMNEKDIKALVDGLKCNTSITSFPTQKKADCFVMLIWIFGYENWQNYLAFLNKFAEKNVFQTCLLYCNYLHDLWRMSQHLEDAREMPWKIYDRAQLERMDEKAKIMLETLDVENYGRLTGMFKKLEKKYKKYEFSTSDFHIQWPKAPEDVIKEGVVLNHCAKTFAQKVAEGGTDMLFIRKNSEPDRPYYTLEIRDGKLRQCHGKNNENATVPIRTFLDDFCEQKGIGLENGYGTTQLGVDN